MAYNGWKNYETWNVALWLGNDEGLYNEARRFKRSRTPFSDLRDSLKEIGFEKTPDCVSLYDHRLSIRELNACIKEF